MTKPNASPGAAGAPGSNPDKDAAAAVLEDLEAVRLRAEAAERDRDQYLDLLRRTKADFQNYEQRTKRDQTQELRFAHGKMALDLLPVLDNFDRAVAAAKQVGETGPLMQGVAIVQAQVLDILKRYGITRIEAKGQPFDPHLHQAVMQQPVAGQPPNTVVEVLEQGFLIHERVLRPARVVVSAPTG